MKTFLTILVLFLLFDSVFYYLSIEEQEITVVEKVRVDKPKDNYYLIFTEDGQVFQNKDKWIILKFNSSDIQAKLKDNKTYTIKTIGWRIPLFSMYKNIISVKE